MITDIDLDENARIRSYKVTCPDCGKSTVISKDFKFSFVYCGNYTECEKEKYSPKENIERVHLSIDGDSIDISNL